MSHEVNKHGELLHEPQPDPTLAPLRWIRRALGMTLRDMAILTGLEAVALSELERRKRKATNKEHKEIARVVGVKLAALLRGELPEEDEDGAE